jgi:hypothetical protein
MRDYCRVASRASTLVKIERNCSHPLLQVGGCTLVGNNTLKMPLNTWYAAINAIAVVGEFPWSLVMNRLFPTAANLHYDIIRPSNVL